MIVLDCEHEYEVLEDNLETVVTRFPDGEVETDTTGYVIFYCKKCLDIKNKVIK